MNDDCLTIDEIFDYIEQKLPLDDLAGIEHHLADCEICRDMIDGCRQFLNREEFKRSVDKLNARIRDHFRAMRN